MSEKVKSPIAIFIILILVSLSFAGTGFFLLQKEKTKNTSLQEELDSLKIKQNAAETKLEEYKKTISQLDFKLKEAQTNIDALSSALEQETKAKQEALDQVQQLKTDLQQQKGLRTDLETKLEQTQKSAERAQAQLKEIESKKAELEAQVQQTQAQSRTQAQGVELGTIVVGPEGGSVSGQATSSLSAEQPKEKAIISSLEGKVLVVNKDYNFAVINLGSKDGVNAGDVFALYHNNKYIGDIKVEKIHESMSAADFTSASIKDVVSEGDRVVQKAK